jgi:hypothetical protein
MITKKVFPSLSEVHARGLVPSYVWSSGWPYEHAQQHGSDFSYHVEVVPKDDTRVEARTASRIGRLSDDERRELIAGLEQLREHVRSRYAIPHKRTPL